MVHHKAWIPFPLIFSLTLLLSWTGCSTLPGQRQANEPSNDGAGLPSALEQAEPLSPKVIQAVEVNSSDAVLASQHPHLGQPTGWGKPLLVSSRASSPELFQRQFSLEPPRELMRGYGAGDRVLSVDPKGNSQHQRFDFFAAQASGRAVDRLAMASPGAQAGGSPPKQGVQDMEKLAQQTNNPIGPVWLLINQNDTTLIEGDLLSDTKVVNVTKIMPVLPVPILGGTWNLVVRPVIQIVSVPLKSSVGSLIGVGPTNITSNPGLASLAAQPFGRTTGLGDSVLLTIAGPNSDDGWIMAFGATQIFPTATDDILGQGKWQAGPAGLLVRLGKDYGGLGIENWNIGALPQQWWSYAGDDNRRETNQMDIQYFINWKMNATQLVGMTPNISIDWKADSGQKVSFPVGLGTIGLFKIGPLPIRWGVEAQYYVVTPDAVGREWNFRIFFAPIVPNYFK